MVGCKGVCGTAACQGWTCWCGKKLRVGHSVADSEEPQGGGFVQPSWTINILMRHVLMQHVFDATCVFLICQFFNFNRVGIVVVASNVLYGTWRLVESWFVQISASSCARTSTARDLWARFIAPPF